MPRGSSYISPRPGSRDAINSRRRAPGVAAVHSLRAGLFPADALPALPSHMSIREDDVAAAGMARGGVRVRGIVGERVPPTALRVLDEADPIHPERGLSPPLTAADRTALDPDG